MSDILRHQAEETTRSHDTVDTLMEIARTLASPRDINEILEQIMHQVSRLLSPKAWSLLLRDEESGELEFAVVVSEVADKLKGIRIPRGHGVAGWVAENGTALIIPDVSQDQRFAADFDKSFSFTTRSLACVPVKCHDRVYGVIELINSVDEVEFDEWDKQILTTIADFAAIAISNERAMAKIKRLVITDDLTGLYNGRYFFEQVEYEVERSRRYLTPFSLVFFDLDRFKTVNDTYGHLVGSRLLTEVGGLVQKLIRRTDKAARYGGDEFVVLLPQTEKHGAHSLALKLNAAIQMHEFFSDGGEILNVTGSFGVATFPDDACSTKELIAASDKAMYLAKERGRNEVCVAGCGEINAGDGA